MTEDKELRYCGKCRAMTNHMPIEPQIEQFIGSCTILIGFVLAYWQQPVSILFAVVGIFLFVRGADEQEAEAQKKSEKVE